MPYLPFPEHWPVFLPKHKMDHGARLGTPLFAAGARVGISTEIADLTVASLPFRLLPEMQRPLYEAIGKRVARLYDGLAHVGVPFDFGEDGAGIRKEGIPTPVYRMA